MSEFNENNQEMTTEKTSVETPVEPAAPAESQEPQFFTDSTEAAAGVEIAKKGPGKIIAVIVAVVVLLFGCSAASYAFVPQVKNTVKMLVNSPEEYYAWVESENADEFSWLTEAFEEAENTDSVANAVINLDSAAIDKLISENTGSSLEQIGFKLPSSIGMEIKSAEVGGIQSANESITIDGNPVMTYNGYVKDGKIYYQIPELSSSYICFDSAQFFEMAASESGDTEAVEMLSAISEMFSGEEEIISDEELAELLTKYSDMLFSSATNVKLSKNAKCEADGVKCNYTKLAVNIDEGSLYTFAKKAVKELKDEKVIIEIAEKFGVTKEQYQTAVKELSDQLGTYEISGGNTLCVMNIFVNNKGEVVGREFVSTEEAEEPFGVGYTLTEDGGKYGFTAYADIEGEKISVNGNAKEKSGKFTGEGSVANNGEDVFNFSFKDIECDDEFVKGSVTLGLSAFELDDMTLNFDAKDGKQTFDTEFTYNGTKLFDIAVEASSETPESITVFNESAKVYNLTNDGAEMEQYLAEVNLKDFATGILKAFGLEAYTDQFIQGFEQGFAGGMTDELPLDTDITDEEGFIEAPEESYDENEVEYDLSGVKVEVNGKAVALPCKIDGILDNVKFEEAAIEAHSFGYGYDDDYTVNVSVENTSDSPLKPQECDVVNLSVTEDAGVAVSVDGITFGDDIQKVAEKYGCTIADTSSGYIDIVDSEEYNYISFFYMDGKIYEIDLSF